MKQGIALMLLASLVVSCTAAPTPFAQTRPATSDPAQPIEVPSGDTFQVVIDSNPSTGYHWEIIGELSGVEFVSRDYTADEPVAPGSGGVDTWTFRAVTTGKVQITLGSYPPDVTEGEPEQTITFNIEVK